MRRECVRCVVGRAHLTSKFCAACCAEINRILIGYRDAGWTAREMGAEVGLPTNAVEMRFTRMRRKGLL